MAQNNTALYLLSFNNYYNRIVKRFETVAEYMEYSVFDPLVCNFNPADGIDTEHIFNLATLQVPPSADYVLAVNEDNEIVSRWFIVNASRVRGGQFRLALHRDLVADFYTDVIQAPTYVERAMVDIANPYIFNSEGISFNQIKKREELLPDETNSGWYVGYVAPNTDTTTITIPTETNISYPAPPISYDDLDAIPSSIARIPDTYNVRVSAPIGGTTKARWLQVSTEGTVLYYNDGARGSVGAYWLFNMYHTAQEDAQYFANAMAQNQATVEDALLAEITGKNLYYGEKINQLIGMDGGTYFDASANKIFTVSMKSAGRDGSFTNRNVSNNGLAYTTIGEILKSSCGLEPGGSYSNSYNIMFDATLENYTLTITDITPEQGIQAVVASTVTTLNDAPYKMFAIPAKGVSVGFVGETSNFTTYTAKEEYNRRFACLSATMFGSQLYDLQYLPYCPIRTKFEDGKIMLNGTPSTAIDKTITLLQKDGVVYSYMLWATVSSFEFNIQKQITVPQTAKAFKVAHETKFCRLVAPNYNGTYEFRPTSNMGIDYFEVACSYRPFQPYIKVMPHYNTGGLYGGDFNDNRGLVCGGDYSLPIATDRWIEYQIQNSSYKESFNRQIENMERVYGYQYQQQKVAGTVGAFTAGISGATTGIMAGFATGNPALGIGLGLAGGVGGGIASAWGLQQDLKYTKAIQKENLDYTRDQFALSLQNIKALPYTLSKVSSISVDYKVFPFIEFYEATETEELALSNKIEYRGMTIGAIGTISDYQKDTPTFIQGSVIRLETLGEDYHLITAIAQEIHEGVYI